MFYGALFIWNRLYFDPFMKLCQYSIEFLTYCDKSLDSSEFQNMDLNYTIILNFILISDAYNIV